MPGKKCSPKMKRCVADVQRSGKSKSAAFGICNISVGKKGKKR